MSVHCCTSECPEPTDNRYRRVLWAALLINGAMFLIEIVAGLMAGSVSLQADALDFLGDVANYGISLFVIGLSLRYRAKAALLKGTTMGLFGLWVASAIIWHAIYGTVPHAVTMGEVGFAALLANAVVFGLLWNSRKGDSNMRSAWLCSRNDVIGNLAVLFAAAGVFGTHTAWPDLDRCRDYGGPRAARRSSGDPACTRGAALNAIVAGRKIQLLRGLGSRQLRMRETLFTFGLSRLSGLCRLPKEPLNRGGFLIRKTKRKRPGYSAYLIGAAHADNRGRHRGIVQYPRNRRFARSAVMAAADFS